MSTGCMSVPTFLSEVPWFSMSYISASVCSYKLSDLVTISFYVISSIRWSVIDFSRTLWILLKNLWMFNSSVIDLRPWSSINTHCILYCALAQRCRPMFWPFLLLVISSHSLNRRF